jgi:hypothetical protein
MNTQPEMQQYLLAYQKLEQTLFRLLGNDIGNSVSGSRGNPFSINDTPLPSRSTR